MTEARTGVRARVAAAFIVATLATSLLFGVMTFAFVYSVEDRIYAEALELEVKRQQEAWQATRRLVEPSLPYARIYRAGDPLPSDLASQLGSSSTQGEYSGEEGRHYHVARFVLPDGGGEAIAVAEVSRFLIVRPQRNAMIALLAAMSIVAALIAALLGWWLANRTLAPLTRLARDVSQGDHAVPAIDVVTYPANEIGALATALEGAFQRIRGFLMREQAFTRDASHELRTPLAVVRGAAEVLAMRADLPQPAREALHRIEAAAMEMTETIDLLLALARESNAPLAGRTSLLPLIEKAIATSSQRFPASPIDVSVAPSAELTALVSPTLAQLVLNNLIGNAFQHASPSRLDIRGEQNVLVIADSGPGLDSGHAAFAPFSRGNDSEGSGLGLAIVRRLCSSASIGLEWSSSAGGTRFRLTFQPA
jgi:signal transduction histidine kinase